MDVFRNNDQIQAMNDLPIQLNGKNLARGLIITSLPGVNSRVFLCPTVPWPQKNTSWLFCECKTSQNNNFAENFPFVISRNLPEWGANDDAMTTNPIFDNIWFVIIGLVILLSFIGICSVLKRANLNMFQNVSSRQLKYSSYLVHQPRLTLSQLLKQQIQIMNLYVSVNQIT